MHKLFENSQSTSSQRHIMGFQICYFQIFHLYSWYFLYILVPILLCFYSRKILNTRLLLVTVTSKKSCIQNHTFYIYKNKNIKKIYLYCGFELLLKRNVLVLFPSLLLWQSFYRNFKYCFVSFDFFYFYNNCIINHVYHFSCVPFFHFSCEAP